jgi:hypothetical protein
MNDKLRTGVASLLVLCLAAAPVFAQQTEYDQGRLQGELDAKGQPIWILSGLLLGPIGLILPWVINPSVPGANLIGKSAEYVAGYMDGYRHEAKPKNFLYSLVGFAVFGAVAAVLVASMASSANQMADACGQSCGSGCSDAFDKWLDNACSPTCSPQFSLR